MSQERPAAVEVRFQEDRVLKAGYMRLMASGYPFSQKIEDAQSSEEAYFLHLEKSFMELPPGLRFDALQDSIDVSHRPRIQKIWEKVQEMEAAWRRTAVVLMQHWEYPVLSNRNKIPEELERALDRLRMEFRGAATAVTAVSEPPPDGREISEVSRAESWQFVEKGLRREFFTADKNYLVALRLYLEMLLEKPGQGDDRPSVLPLDHPLRWDIVKSNRALQLIDTVHQSFAGAKAAHHQQEEGRVRDMGGGAIPYIDHPVEVTQAMIVDVLSFVLFQRKLEIPISVIATVAAFHDLGEDTELTMEDITRFFERLADRYDTKIDPVIVSGFGLSREQVKQRILNLVTKEKVHRQIIQILRVLAKNTVLKNEEKSRALRENIAGPEKTAELLGMTPEAMRGWKVPQREEPSNTFEQFPVSWDSKLDQFLVRLSSVPSRDLRTLVLLVKLGDRASNLRTIDEFSPAHQQKQLRGTVSRLLAWAMLDHDRDRQPLYRALGRLVTVTRQQYEHFQQQYPDYFDQNIDAALLKRLMVWDAEIQNSYALTGEAAEVFAEYEKAHGEPEAGEKRAGLIQELTRVALSLLPKTSRA